MHEKVMMTNKPKISVITVCLNAVRDIEITMNSVLWQRYQPIEYLIVDGGSNDGTADLIRKYAGRLSYWVSEPDKGIYDAMNKALDHVTGDWVYFLGAGDILLNVLHRLVPHFTRANRIYYGDVYITEDACFYQGRFSAFRLAVWNISHQAIFYPAAVFTKYRYDTRYRFLADHHLNMRCFGDPDFRFRHLSELVCIYQGGGASATHPDAEFYRDKPSLIRANFPFPVYVYTQVRRLSAKLLNRT